MSKSRVYIKIIKASINFLLQKIQIHCLSTTDKLVLGLAWEKDKSHIAKLCSAKDSEYFSICYLHRFQIPTVVIYISCQK